MRFPETTRVGSEGHKDAIRRLDVAREERRRRGEDRRAAQGTGRERDADRGVAAADERVAAREAWVKWVERGY
jgi:hypothetical protein